MLRERPRILNRVLCINNALLQSVKTVYRLRKIGYNVSDGRFIYAYAVSIVKTSPYTIEEQVMLFYDACKKLLSNNERLITDKKCFKIVSEEFEACYCIEAWRKNADKIGYIEDGRVMVEPLHRMSCEQAAYIFKKHGVDPFGLLNTLEALQGYDNPADKYTALAKKPYLFKEAIREVR